MLPAVTGKTTLRPCHAISPPRLPKHRGAGRKSWQSHAAHAPSKGGGFKGRTFSLGIAHSNLLRVLVISEYSELCFLFLLVPNTCSYRYTTNSHVPMQFCLLWPTSPHSRHLYFFAATPTWTAPWTLASNLPFMRFDGPPCPPNRSGRVCQRLAIRDKRGGVNQLDGRLGKHCRISNEVIPRMN